MVWTPWWSLRQSDVEAYQRMFAAADWRGEGKVTLHGSNLERLGAPASVVAQIWRLVDADNDGAVDADQYSVACHLLARYQQHRLPVPAAVPPKLTKAVAEARQAAPLLQPTPPAYDPLTRSPRRRRSAERRQANASFSEGSLEGLGVALDGIVADTAYIPYEAEADRANAAIGRPLELEGGPLFGDRLIAAAMQPAPPSYEPLARSPRRKSVGRAVGLGGANEAGQTRGLT